MIKHIQEKPAIAALETALVKDFHAKFSTITESHVDTVDISKPVILAEISPGRFNLIDGNHRVEKARRQGVESLPAFRLEAKEHISFLTSKEAYLAFIDYWNGKLREME